MGVAGIVENLVAAQIGKLVGADLVREWVGLGAWLCRKGLDKHLVEYNGSLVVEA